MEKEIYTIGHSTRSLTGLLDLLLIHKIKVLADVRSLPGSKKFPHFNKENLEVKLPEEGIEYIHLKELGGRRKLNKNSNNTFWKNKSFRAYADYMETDGFKKGIEKLTGIALSIKTSFMCSEMLWWRCHRSMISDYLKLEGWKVFHIMNETKTEEHPERDIKKLYSNLEVKKE